MCVQGTHQEISYNIACVQCTCYVLVELKYKIKMITYESYHVHYYILSCILLYIMELRMRHSTPQDTNDPDYIYEEEPLVV